MRKLIMLVGLPGSGKSTWVNTQMKYHVGDDEPWRLISTDRIIDIAANATGKTYNEIFRDETYGIEAATKIISDYTDLVIAKGENAVIDQTNLSKKSRARKLRPFKEAGYLADCYFFRNVVDVEALNKVRVGKTISPKLFESMKLTLEPPTLDEGFRYVYEIIDGHSSNIFQYGF